ncbi:class I SAM-dependent methyltransferase [Microvirga vignae]|uniref:class I SAM-dependent methyltransferase n=1 Tax=Microvirga vignae TaxID=1225564 RepID=UPI00069AD9B2|nr:class I SAM-dependent methyltransferase [Microvirga vignae]
MLPTNNAATVDALPDRLIEPTTPIDALITPAADPLFWSPKRLGKASAWWGHVPFAHWIVATIRPKLLVELGTHHGVSYAAFCEAVRRQQLDTKCYAVDTWEGDEHAGQRGSAIYGDDVYSDLLKFHDANYGAFSRLLKQTFDGALDHFSNGSIDLLHIDGLHTYEAVSRDFQNWLPKLSRRGVVLFHDTNERGRDFGVWQFWSELTQRYPSFEFLHEHGLGILAVGPEAPEVVQRLCGLDAIATSRVRERFNHLGTRWIGAYREEELTRDAARRNELLEANIQKIASLEARIEVLAEAECASIRQAAALERSVLERDERIGALERSVLERDERIGAIYHTRSWRWTQLARSIMRHILHVKQVFRLAGPAVRLGGGIKKTLYRAVKLYQREGFSGIKRGFRVVASAQQASEAAAEIIDASIRIRDLPRPTNLPAAEVQVDVIIPVYRGVAETKRCIDSVLDSIVENHCLGQIIVIDDRGPEDDMQAYLETLKQDDRLTVLVNEQNQGFVLSVNRGMTYSNTNDVILLNSDTEVSGNWIDRLAAQAYAEPTIATVTPFSNNATICSFPALPGDPNLASGDTVTGLDTAFSQANQGNSVDIPTAVGFCMYIKRAALRQIGLFDAKAFGLGYGEENDFCLRVQAHGGRNILAGDVFVYHVGETSFGATSSPGKARAAQIIRDRYPHYEKAVADWVQQDPARPMRLAAVAARVQRNNRPVVLFMLHDWGGGTEKHALSLAEQLSSNIAVVILKITSGQEGINAALSVIDGDFRFDEIVSAADLKEFVDFIKSFGVTRIHVHHIIGFQDQIQDILLQLGLPYDLTIHDYTLICPRVNLWRPDEGYCGEPDEAGCLACLSCEPKPLSRDIIWWREKGRDLIAHATRVICPSKDVAARMRRYVPEGHYIVVPHEDLSDASSRKVTVPALSSGAPLRIAVLGFLNDQKGRQFLQRCIDEFARANVKISLVVIGDVLGAALMARGNVTLSVTGPYKAFDVDTMIDKYDPHLIFFTQRSPETYSFTLSEGIRSGRPLVVPRIGALTERAQNLQWCWLYDLSDQPSDLVRLFQSIRRSIEANVAPISLNEDGHRHDNEDGQGGNVIPYGRFVGAYSSSAAASRNENSR